MHYELEVDARDFIYNAFKDYAIAIDNVNFKPPSNGATWLQFQYMPAVSEPVSLDRQCMVYIGMVQVNVVFRPGIGNDEANKLAGAIARTAKDGIMLPNCYIYECGKVHPVQKSETGWFVPVRFAVRTETK